MTKEEARIMWKYYDELIGKLTSAKIALLEGGAQSYTIGDRSLTRFDLSKLSGEIDDAIKKRDEYEAIMNGRGIRSMIGIIPTDM